MSKVDVSQAICQAIDIIVDKKLAGAGFNKTIQARIDKVIDSENGLYSIQYQDSIADNVQALDKNIVYEPGDSVMVLIPSNDWTGKKIIIASNKNLANTTIEDGEFYNVIGETVVYQPQGINTISLSSYREISNAQLDQQIIFELAEQAVAENQYNQKLKRYIRQSANGLILSAYIRTDFDNDRFNKLGIYGVDYTLLFNNGTENYTKTFTLDVRDVLGQPYLLNRTTLVEHIEKEINATEFVGIQKIVAYVENFNADTNKYNNNIKIYDVFVSNVSVCAAQVLGDQQINGVNLWLSYPNGTRITTSQPGIIVNTVTIKAKLRNNGRDIDNNVQYRWYRENAAVGTADPKTDLYAGSGWECLHLIDGAAASLTQNDFSFTNQAIEETDVRTMQVNSAKTRIRCIAIYQNRPYSQYLTIEYDNGIEITLDSSDKKNGVNQDIYYNYNSTNPPIVMRCLVAGEIDQNNYQYKWTIKGNGLNWKNEESTPSVTFSQLQNYSQITFICTVLSNNGAFIGTVSHTVQNKKGISGQYTIQVLNGSKIIQYYDDGSLTEGIAFTPLELAFYDPDSNIINLQLPEEGKQTDIQQIVWSIPRNNTLIQLTNPPSQEVTGALIPDPAGSETDYYHIKNITSLSYSFASSYNANAINNTIHVYILYKTTSGELSQFHGLTTFQIIKAGDPGTNGTDTVASIITKIGANEQVSRRVYFNNTDNDTNIERIYLDNIGLSFSNSDTLNFKLVQNNNDIDLAPGAMQWSLPVKNNLTSWFILDGNPLSSSIIPPWELNTSIASITSLNNIQTIPSNILRAKYTINDLVYYAEMPLVYVYTINDNYKLKLKETSGYTFVKYTQSGMNPKYDNNNQFEIEVYNGTNLDETNLTYSWKAFGNFMPITSADNKTCVIQPNNILFADTNNLDLTSGVGCQVFKNGTSIGFLVAPVYMYKNRYNHPYLNDWDGNSIQLDANGNQTILAPQVGAGKKNNDSSFTGVLIGEVKEDNNLYKTGLLAYNQGERTVFVDATTGNAEFGKTGAGQIKISANGQAVIQSGDYSQNTGIKIKFSNTNIEDGQGPYIKYGTGKFSVDSEGNLTAQNANITGNIVANTGNIGGENGWIISENTLSTNNGNVNLYSNHHSSGLAMQVINNNQTVFSIGQNGKLNATNAYIEGNGTFKGIITAEAGGKIGGWHVDSNALSAYNGAVVLRAVTGGATNMIEVTKSGNTVFSVNGNGELTATKGTIGGWKINSSDLSSQNDLVFMNSDPTKKPISTITPIKGQHAFLRVKESDNGSVKFIVTHQGSLYASKAYIVGEIHANDGDIGGWKISSDRLSTNDGRVMLLDSSNNNSIRVNDANGEIVFAVSKNGKLTATNADITGKITATEGSFTGKITADSGTLENVTIKKSCTIKGTLSASQIKGGDLDFDEVKAKNLTVTNSMIESVNAGKINAGTISADRISAGTLSFKKLKYTENGKASASDIVQVRRITVLTGLFPSTDKYKLGVNMRTFDFLCASYATNTSTDYIEIEH